MQAAVISCGRDGTDVLSSRCSCAAMRFSVGATVVKWCLSCLFQDPNPRTLLP